MPIDPKKDLKRIYSNYQNKKAENNAKFLAQSFPLKIIDISTFICVIALTFYIIEKETWPASLFIHNHMNAQGEYPAKLVYLETALCAYLPFAPIRYVLRRVFKKKETE